MASIFRSLDRRPSLDRGSGDVDARLDWPEDLSVTHLVPVKPVRDGNAVNKAERLVLRGWLGDKAVKVYETASAQHSRFIREVSQTIELGDHWPGILAGADRFLVAQWIEGRTLSARSRGQRRRLAILGEVAAFQARLHKKAADSLPAAGFDYWHDLIRPRFCRACSILGAHRCFREIAALVDAHWETEPAVLMHPDLRPANLVCAHDGRWYLIDNELLTTGGMPLLDVEITLGALPPPSRKMYLARYAEARGGLSLCSEQERALAALWLAREMSRCFVGGNLGGARHLLSAHQAGRTLLPSGLSMAEGGAPVGKRRASTMALLATRFRRLTTISPSTRWHQKGA